MSTPDFDACPGIEEHTGPVQDVHRLSGGNNPVWQIDGRDRQAVLKFYGAANDPDAVDRYHRETTWLEKTRFLPQPSLLAIWPGALACLQDLAGDGPGPDRQKTLIGLEMALERLARSVDAPETALLPMARDHGLVPAGLAEQLARRLDSFSVVQDQAFRSLWHGQLLPLATRLLSEAETWSQDTLPTAWQMASPSDMGGHNMIQSLKDSPVFLDFEFAGRDDPALLVLDVLLHEHGRWSQMEKFWLLEGLADHYGEMPDFVERLFRYWPLVQMMWILIVLNPWRASHTRRLQAAGVGDIAELRAERLVRADYLLSRFDDERQLSGDLIANIF